MRLHDSLAARSALLTGLASSFVLLAAGTGFGQPASLLQNGSFESGYTGWTASGDQVIAVNDPAHPASDGSSVVVLNVNDTFIPAVLSQTFATTSGQRYGLAFDVGRVGGVIDGRLRVRLQGTGTLLDQVFEFSALNSSAFYIPHHITFVANSSTTTLTFTDLSISPRLVDVLLDNVRIVAENDRAPLVTAQPQRAAVMVGRNATFSVAASGSGNLAYRWQFQGVDIPGATSSSYTVAGSGPSNAGNYRVLVTNAHGTVSSSSATLTVLPAAIVLNGGFEYGWAGWSLNDINRVYTTLNPVYAYIEGVQLMHFNYGQALAGGAIGQTLNTIPGEQYVLTFDVGATSFLNQDEQRMQVTVQGQQVLVSDVIAVSAPGNGTRYLPQSFAFVADQATATLLFTDVSIPTSNVDLILDNVRVIQPSAVPVITGQPQGLTVDAGSSATFTVTATASGGGTLFYQWRYNGTAIPGASSSSLTIVNAQAANAGSYDVRVWNVAGSVLSDSAALTVRSGPVIVSQPQSTTVQAGSPATFSVTASGQAPFSYAWFRNGAAIAGANGSSYSIPAAQSSDAGPYHVVVSNAFGATTSAIATLTVVTAGGLANGSFEQDYAGWTATGNQGVVSGSFWVATDGVKAIAFNAGQRTPDGVLSQQFATTPGQSYTLAFDAGVLNGSGGSQVQRIAVSVQGTASLLTQTVSLSSSGNGTVYTAQSFTFTADASAATLTFQDVSLVTLNVDLMLDNLRVTPAATPPPGLANGSFESNYANWTASGHQGVATNDPGYPASDGAKVVVFNANDLINSAVLAQTFQTTPGQRYRLSFDLGTVGAIADQRVQVQVAGNGILLDQILTVSGIDAQPFYVPQRLSFVANSASTTLTFTDRSITYFVIDTLLDNVVVATEAAGAPWVTSQPARTAVPLGGTASFSVGVSGSGPFTYQWRFNGSSISGANGSTYSVTAANGSQAGNYSVTVTNAGGSVTSSAATLTVIPSAILLNGSFEYGSAAWTFSDPSDVSTSTNTNYGVTDGGQLVHFNFADRPPAGILSQSFPTTPGQGYVLQFDVGAFSNGNQNEQRMQVSLQGASTLLAQQISVFAPGQGGAYVARTFAFTADSATTTLVFQDSSLTTIGVDLLLDNVRVSLANTPPVITTQPASLTVAAGSSASFSVTATGAVSYQWRKAGAAIAGATSSTYTIASAQPGDAGSYTVAVTNGNGTTESAAATLTVTSAPPPAPGFTNGSFESNYTGWTATGAQAIVTAGSVYAVTDGSKAVGFNGGQQTPNGVLAQTFATTPGQSYTLTFDVGALSFVNQDVQRLQVTAQGTATLLTQTVSVSAPGNGTSFVARSFAFTADSSATTLTFRDVSLVTVNVDLILDNVRVALTNTPPVITTQPASLTVVAGSSASFSVTATGAVSYQWRKAGGAIAGATSSTFTIASAQAGDAGSYTVAVTNGSGTTVSAAATLTVTSAPPPAPGFTNGSFESNYTGWTATGAQAIVTAGSVYAVTDGSRANAFNGGQQTPNGVLAQTFATTPGQAYTLTFDVGALSFVNQDVQRLQVTAQGTATLLTQTVSVSAPGNGTSFIAQSFAFTADSSATTLTFRDVSLVTVNVDLILDNVRVTIASAP